MKLYRLPKKWIRGPFEQLWKRIAFHIVLAVFGALLIEYFNNDLSLNSTIKMTCLIVANDFAMTIGHIYIFQNLDLNFDWLKDTYKRFVFGAIFHTLYSAGIFLILQLVLFNWLYGMNSEETIAWILHHWWIPLGVTALVIVLTTTIGFLDEWKKSLIAEEELKAEMMAYKFESLKSQVNPSFLFDNFHSLKELIKSDQKKAVGVIQKMSQLYRSVLESKDMELISLENEMQQVDLYLELLRLRYGVSLEVKAEINTDKHELVVPGVVQNIIQLLLKGLETSGAVKRTISLSRSEGYLSVLFDSSDVGRKYEFNEDSIDILQQRYQFFTDNTIKIASKNHSVSISIPVLREEL